MSKEGVRKTQEFRKPLVRAELNLEGLVKKKNRVGTVYYENSKGEIVAKRCLKCGKVKALEDYVDYKRSVGGKFAQCKICKSESDLEWRKENREKERIRNKKWREANKEYIAEKNRNYYKVNKKRILKRTSKYYKKNKGHYSDYNFQWYKDNKERKKATQRIWVEKNKENVAITQQKYHARKKLLTYTLTTEEYAKTLKHFKNACALTGCTDVKLEVEHAIPLSIGHGGTTFGNCYPILNGLNQSKGNRNIFEWFEANRQRFELSQERFDKLIAWLASANAMTVEEYRDYVYWCHENPRDINEIKSANDGGNRQAL